MPSEFNGGSFDQPAKSEVKAVSMDEPASGDSPHAAIVREISHALGESATLAEAAPRMLAGVCEPLGWDYGALWEVDRAGQTLRFVGSYHAPARPFDRFTAVSQAVVFAPGIGLLGRVWVSRRPAWIADVVLDGNFLRATAAAETGLHGAFAVPLVRGADVLGVMEFFSRDIRQPDAELLETMSMKRSSPIALRPPTRFFEALTRAAPVGIFHADAHGHITYTNERWTEICGLSAARSLGDGWIAAVHSDDRNRVKKEWLACVTGGSAYAIDYRIVQPSGETRFVHAEAVTLFTPAGCPRGHTGTLDDLTARASAEHELRESLSVLESSRQRLQALFEYSLDAIVLSDNNGQYVDVNPAACELFGTPREELLMRRVPHVTTPELSAVFDRQWQAFLTAGAQSGDYVLLRPDGTTRDVEYRAVAHVLPGTHLSILRDATERTRLDRERRRYVQRLENMSAIDRAILDAQSPVAIADTVVRMVGRQFPAVRVSLILFDRAKRNARHVAVWSQQPTRVGAGTEMSIGDDVVGRELLEGRTSTRSHFERDHLVTWIDRVLFDEGVRSILRIPLRSKSGTLGSLNISSGEREGLDELQVVIAEEVADRVAVAMEGAQLFEDLQSSAAHLAMMSRRLVEVQDMERRDVARELHDEIGQMLTGLRLQLDLAVKKTTGRSPKSLTKCTQLVHDLVSKVRRLSLNLRPPLLDDFGLRKALLSYFERFTAQTSVHIRFSSAGPFDERFSVVVETAVFRIVQESLTNVARHAGTDRADVEIRVADNRVCVSVTDRGRGFIIDAPPTAGTGLTGMRERVVLLGGVFHVSSVPAEGTTVEAQIPVLASEGRHG